MLRKTENNSQLWSEIGSFCQNKSLFIHVISLAFKIGSMFKELNPPSLSSPLFHSEKKHQEQYWNAPNHFWLLIYLLFSRFVLFLLGNMINNQQIIIQYTYLAGKKTTSMSFHIKLTLISNLRSNGCRPRRFPPATGSIGKPRHLHGSSRWDCPSHHR